MFRLQVRRILLILALLSIMTLIAKDLYARRSGQDPMKPLRRSPAGMQTRTRRLMYSRQLHAFGAYPPIQPRNKIKFTRTN